MSSQKKPNCSSCDAKNALLKCSSCSSVNYCNKECQVAHWKKGHKLRCRELKEKREAALVTAVSNPDVRAGVLDATFKESEAVAGSAEALHVEQEQQQQQQQQQQHQQQQQQHHQQQQQQQQQQPPRQQQQREDKAKPATEAGNCWTCGADNPRNLCNRCKVTKYCGVACQTEHWPIHKTRCKDLRENAASFEVEKELLKAFARGEGPMPAQDVLNGMLLSACLLGRLADMQRMVAAGAQVNCARPDSGGTPLHQAAQNGHHRVVEALVQHGARLQVRNRYGLTSLYMAVQENHFRATEALISLGASVNAADHEDGFTPCHRAVQNSNSRIIELLLQHGANANARSTSSGATALCLAGEFGDVAVISALLSHGAEVDLLDHKRMGALYFSSQNSHPEAVALLLGRGAQVDVANGVGVTPLFIASMEGHAACVRLLQQAGADVNHCSSVGNIGNYSPCFLAAKRGHVDVLDVLIGAGAQLGLKDSRGFTPLCAGILSNRLDVVLKLLQGGADANQQQCTGGATPLMAAASLEQECPSMMAALLEHGALADTQGGDGATSLYLCVLRSDIQSAAVLLRHGAQVNLASENGSPLNLAAQIGCLGLVELLLAHGALINHRNIKGATPLTLASSNGHAAIVQHLLQAGADAHVLANDGFSCLLAAIGKSPAIAIMLLQHSSLHKDLPNPLGQTPLREAALRGQTAVVRLLLQLGANPLLCDRFGCGPLHVAVSFNHGEIAAMLRTRIAQL